MPKGLSDKPATFSARPDVTDMPPDRDFISIRELQKMSAGAIQALRRPLTIKSGTVTVGELRPIRRVERIPLSVIEASRRRMDELDALLTEEDAQKMAAARKILGLPDEDDAA